MVNSFILHGMNTATASMNAADFKYAVMMGFIERYIPHNTIDKAAQDVQKIIRA